VVDSQTNLPLQDATVTADDGTTTFSSSTDAGGSYKIRIENTGVSACVIGVQKTGYLETQPQELKAFPSNTYTLNFSLSKAVLGVNISPESWHMGTVDPSAIIAMTDQEAITVTNTGNTAETYSLMLIDPLPWKSSQSEIGREQYILNASFASASSAISWNENRHALSVNARPSTDILFASDQTGVNVPVSEERKLYLQFKAPSSTSMTKEQEIKVIINAQLP